MDWKLQTVDRNLQKFDRRTPRFSEIVRRTILQIQSFMKEGYISKNRKVF